MEQFLDFFLLREPNIQTVVFGCILFSVCAALVGSFVVLRRTSLIGDAVSHSILPGVCLGFLLTPLLNTTLRTVLPELQLDAKNPLVLITGATFSGLLAYGLIYWITGKTRIKQDAAIGITLSIFFGIGIMILSAIQQKHGGSASGLSAYLFGSAATILKTDVRIFTGITVIIFVILLFFFRTLTVTTFDKTFAISIGMNVFRADLVLAVLTVVTISMGIQAVGVVLMSALLITPVIAARYWTNNMQHLLYISVLFAILSSVLGAFVSYLYPKMPTGPWIVVIASTLAIGSMLLAPKRGVLFNYFRRLRHQEKIQLENILKIFYHLGEKDGKFTEPRFLEELIQKRQLERGRLIQGLGKLTTKRLIQKKGETWMLEAEGLRIASRITKLHRLWEMYLTQHLKIAEDHVHDNAEAIEHVITPELEAELERTLKYPTTDPHGKPIQYNLPE